MGYSPWEIWDILRGRFKIFSVEDLRYSLWEIWDTHRERFGIFYVGDLGYSPWEIWDIRRGRFEIFYCGRFGIFYVGNFIFYVGENIFLDSFSDCAEDSDALRKKGMNRAKTRIKRKMCKWMEIIGIILRARNFSKKSNARLQFT